MANEKDIVDFRNLVQIEHDKEKGTFVTKHGTAERNWSIMWIGRTPDALSYINAAILFFLGVIYLAYILSNQGAVSLYVGVGAMIGIFHGLGITILNIRHTRALKRKTYKNQVKKVGKITFGMGILMIIYAISAMIFDNTVAIYSGVGATSELWMLMFYGAIALYFSLVGTARGLRNRKDRLILHSTYFSLDWSAASGLVVIFYGCLINYLNAWNGVLVVIGVIIAMSSGIYRLTMGVSLLVRGGMGENLKLTKQFGPIYSFIDKYRVVFWFSEVYALVFAIYFFSLAGVSSAYVNVGNLYAYIGLLRLFNLIWCDACDGRFKDNPAQREKHKAVPFFVSGALMLMFSFSFVSAIRLLLNNTYSLSNSSGGISGMLILQVIMFLVLLIWNIYSMAQGNVKRDAFSVLTSSLNILLSTISGFTTLLTICAFFKGEFIDQVAIFLAFLMILNFANFTIIFFIYGNYSFKNAAKLERGYGLIN